MTTMKPLKVLVTDDVKISAALSDGVIKVTMSGNVEMRDPRTVIDPYWVDIDAEAAKLGITKIEVDLRSVGFMNSSGILTFVRWLTRLKERAEGPRCSVLFRYDTNVTWQRTNLPVLAKLAPGVVHLSDSE